MVVGGGNGCDGYGGGYSDCDGDSGEVIVELMMMMMM